MDNKNKIKVRPFRQSAGFCGPASLKILLSHFGKNFTEKELANLCSSTREIGTEHEGMIKALKKIGGFVFAKENGTVEELEYLIKDQKLPVIIDWFDKDGDHYSVVVGIDKKNIVIVDPAKNMPERWLDRKLFPSIWFSFVGNDNKIVSWKWYLAVTFEKKNFKIKGGTYY